LTDREIEEMVELSTLKVLEVDGKGSQPKSWLDEFEEKIPKGEDCATVFKVIVFRFPCSQSRQGLD